MSKIADQMKEEASRLKQERETIQEKRHLAEMEKDRKDLENGAKKAEEQFNWHVGRISEIVKIGGSHYWYSFHEECSPETRGYMDKLAEMLSAEGFEAVVKIKSQCTPGRGSDPYSDEWHSWFQLEVTWPEESSDSP